MALRANIGECQLYRDPTIKPDYLEADVQALRAMMRGDATADQQKRGINWLLWAYGTHDMSFRPGEPDLTAFAEGRRSAGTILTYMLQSAESSTDPDKISVRNVTQRDQRV